MNSSETQAQRDHQNVVVMRHGDREHNFDHLGLWVKNPWDPSLVEAGRVRAFSTGRKLRNNLGFPIHRVFVSPFLCGVETASEVVSALCSIDDGLTILTSNDVSIDPSKVKVSIEFGLCEVLNREAIRSGFPQDGNWGFNISELEAMLPAGTVDNNVEPVYREMPQWEETVAGARARYLHIFKALADKYPTENLLLVTHGEGIGVAFTAFKKDTTVNAVENCAHIELRRPIVHKDGSFVAGDFETLKGQGISYIPSNAVANDVNYIDWVVIDQGIAYMLMLLALLVTYMNH